jgi:hypothetical protein
VQDFPDQLCTPITQIIHTGFNWTICAAQKYQYLNFSSPIEPLSTPMPMRLLVLAYSHEGEEEDARRNKWEQASRGKQKPE